jgi:hypothetical protein
MTTGVKCGYGSNKLYRRTMEMEQMMERMVAAIRKMDANL